MAPFSRRWRQAVEHDPVVATDEGRRGEMDVAEHPGGDDRPREAVRGAAPPLLLDRQVAPPREAASVITRQPRTVIDSGFSHST